MLAEVLMDSPRNTAQESCAQKWDSCEGIEVMKEKIYSVAEEECEVVAL